VDQALDRIAEGKKGWQGLAWILERRHGSQFQRKVVVEKNEEEADYNTLTMIKVLKQMLAESPPKVLPAEPPDNGDALLLAEVCGEHPESSAKLRSLRLNRFGEA